MVTHTHAQRLCKQWPHTHTTHANTHTRLSEGYLWQAERAETIRALKLSVSLNKSLVLGMLGACPCVCDQVFVKPCVCMLVYRGEEDRWWRMVAGVWVGYG